MACAQRCAPSYSLDVLRQAAVALAWCAVHSHQSAICQLQAETRLGDEYVRPCKRCAVTVDLAPHFQLSCMHVALYFSLSVQHYS